MPRRSLALWIALALALLDWTRAVPAGAASFPVLRPGEHGGEVAIWQATLNIMVRDWIRPPHSRPLAVDGDFGPLTERATRRVQRWLHVQATGVVGPATWLNYEGGAVTPSCMYVGGVRPPPLREGDWFPCVGAWQFALDKWLKHNDPGHPPLIPDGVFGPLTLAATLRFQTAKGLAVDGLVGPRTWHAAPSGF